MIIISRNWQSYCPVGLDLVLVCCSEVFSTDLENVRIEAGTVEFLVCIQMTICVSHCCWLLCILGWTKSSS